MGPLGDSHDALQVICIAIVVTVIVGCVVLGIFFVLNLLVFMIESISGNKKDNDTA